MQQIHKSAGGRSDSEFGEVRVHQLLFAKKHCRTTQTNKHGKVMTIPALWDIVQRCKNEVVEYVNRHRIGPNGDEADSNSYTVAKWEHECAQKM
jgi:hypothetical protein